MVPVNTTTEISLLSSEIEASVILHRSRNKGHSYCLRILCDLFTFPWFLSSRHWRLVRKHPKWMLYLINFYMANSTREICHKKSPFSVQTCVITMEGKYGPQNEAGVQTICHVCSSAKTQPLKRKQRQFKLKKNKLKQIFKLCQCISLMNICWWVNKSIIKYGLTSL